MGNQHHNSHVTVTEISLGWRPILTAGLKYRQISPNMFLLTNCPVNITVSEAVSQADLRTPDMNRVK